ncbi:MAG: hypothetical protein A3J55_00840 [Candidatus Ryanbacteria bacterium RIFCSPHIGHO2_02_FULL_45_17b]|uniref:DUF7282 domain-containing protein n=1 Tax=Candidatus Ryanbacteria bacterium RIFCSPHIGHO2_01_FULL_45_22 TaxID=1802114 RepID=A0A1G2G0V4_9BACT|nr:MAG: hypothetical protein A2719_03305 [Candidatus Ryanbacteria bacterium RIFCSPHIGHO2_01_FULL_45_22]OGZ47088.1 MAG: hypothetical protein A3J55_00840 [Candidatus Ryanbacteria bacterium RIFCSPHIGHO2_02_FULL_45_17b]
MLQRLNENKDLIIVAIASFFIGFGVASLFTGDTNKDSSKDSAMNPTLAPLPFNKESAGKGTETNVAAGMMPSSGTDMVVVENQRAGASVLVQKADFSEARWVVVRETNDDGAAGNILGAGWFPGGVHENMLVPLLRDMVGGERYKAELFSDSNGDKQFDHKTDEPVKDAAGNMISVSFNTIASADGE